MEDLWKVAKGDIKYQDFAKGSIPRKQESQQAPPPLPEELVSRLSSLFQPHSSTCMLTTILKAALIRYVLMTASHLEPCPRDLSTCLGKLYH